MKMYTKAGSVEFKCAASACSDGWIRHPTCHMNVVHQTMPGIHMRFNYLCGSYGMSTSSSGPCKRESSPDHPAYATFVSLSVCIAQQT